MTDLRSEHQKRISTAMKAWWKRCRRKAELERKLRLALSRLQRREDQLRARSDGHHPMTRRWYTTAVIWAGAVIIVVVVMALIGVG